MYKVSQVSPNGKITVSVEGVTVKEAYDKLAEATEIFFVTAAAKQKGQIVESDDVRFVVRTIDNNVFREAVIQSGKLYGYKLSFGDRKDGGIYQKNKLPEKDRIPGLHGWYRYHKDEKETQDQPQTKERAF